MMEHVFPAPDAKRCSKWIVAAGVVLASLPAHAVCNLPPLQATATDDRPSAVTASPDDQNVYLASFAADSVTVYRRDAAGCVLTFVESRIDGVTDFSRDLDVVNGLNGASALAVSPDGSSLYVTGANDNAVAVFHRDAGNEGKLDFLEAYVNAQNLPPNVLRQPKGVVVSQDGLNVYAVAKNSDTLVVFRRLPDGKLEMLEYFRNGSMVDGLKGPSGVAVTNDGLNVYVSGSGDGTVAVFRRDPNDEGRLTFGSFLTKALIPGLAGASAVSVSPDDAYVYVTGLTANTLVVLARNLDDPPSHPGYGSLMHVQTKTANASIRLHDPSSVTVARPDGLHVYVTSSQDDSLLAFARDQGHGTVQLVETRTDGDPGVPSLDKPVNVAVSTDGCVYVASMADNALMAFDRFEPDTTSCNDYNPCTTTDHCDGAGLCAGTCNVGMTCPIPCFGANSTCEILAGSVCGCASDW